MVGCDLHDKSMLLKIATGADDPITWRCLNTVEGRESMLGELLARGQRLQSPRIVFVYEASGLGFGLHDQLRQHGIECYVLAPTHLPKTPGGRRNKTDERDAQMLLEQCRGHVLAGNRLCTVWIPPARLRDDRDLVRTRLDTAEAGARLKVQVLCLLKRNGVVLPEFFLRCRHWTKQWIAWLRTTAESLPCGAAVVLRSYVERWQALHQELLQLDRAIRTLAATPCYAAPATALQALPGVGCLTAMVFLTEMGDLTRFKNRRQVGAYLGLVPSAFESGDRDDRKGHITHQGPSRVRKILCQATWASIWKDATIKETWERLRNHNPKRSKKAVVALMRRLAIRMWHVALACGVDSSLVSPAETTPPLRLDERGPAPVPPLSLDRPKASRGEAAARAKAEGGSQTAPQKHARPKQRTRPKTRSITTP